MAADVAKCNLCWQEWKAEFDIADGKVATPKSSAIPISNAGTGNTMSPISTVYFLGFSCDPIDMEYARKPEPHKLKMDEPNGMDEIIVPALLTRHVFGQVLKPKGSTTIHIPEGSFLVISPYPEDQTLAVYDSQLHLIAVHQFEPAVSSAINPLYR